jgi:hypothetical protein
LAGRGDDVELVEIHGEAGRHRAHLDPRGAGWAAVTLRLHDRRPLASAQVADSSPGI